MKNKSKTIVCDDYIDPAHIKSNKAVDDFIKKNDLKFASSKR